MDKEQALNEFLKSLRVALTNALAYSKDHPYFKECAEKFLHKTEAFLEFTSPIKIIFSPDALYLEERPLENVPLYAQIAHIFHIRKIKSLDIIPGVKIEELIAFLVGISRPVKEILNEGGMHKFLLDANVRHIGVEELDYSEVLRSKGEDAKDVWAVLAKDALQKRDRQKVLNFANDFSRQIEDLKEKDLLDDEELRQNISLFFEYLREEDREKAAKCSAELFRSVAKIDGAQQEGKAEKIKSLFKHMSEEDFAGLLKEEILTDRSFDALSFQLFSRIAGAENEAKITSHLIKDLEAGHIKSDPEAEKTIQDLLSQVDNQFISEVYRNTLSAMVKSITFGPGWTFDHKLLQTNYRGLILGLFLHEEDKVRLGVIVERMAEEFSEAIKSKDFAYAKKILDILKDKREKFPKEASLFEVLDLRVSDFVEKAIWQQSLSVQEENYLIELVVRPASQMQDYLDKIFLERKTSPNSLKLFFRFFPSSGKIFYRMLNERSADMDFMLRIVDNLASLGLDPADEVVRLVVSTSSPFIKLKLLKEIKKLTDEDRDFLISLLEKNDIAMKKDALSILVKKGPAGLKEAADKLFALPSFLGFGNGLLIENMSLALEAGLKEAGPYVQAFSRKPFFWNAKLRQKAYEILEKSNAG